MRISDIITIYTNVAFIRIDHCIFCLQIWDMAIVFDYKAHGKGRHLKILAPPIKKERIFNNWFLWKKYSREKS